MKNIVFILTLLCIIPSDCFTQNIAATLAEERQSILLNLSNDVYRVALANKINPVAALLTAKERNLQTRADGKIFVEIEHGWNEKEWGDLDLETIPYFDVTNEYNSLKGGWISTSDLKKLSDELPANYMVQAANNYVNDHEGITVTNSLDYKNNGAQGQGVKIGIIDPQWLSWAAAQAAGTVPFAPTAQVDHINPGGAWSTGTSAHGTGVTEIIYEFAPGASYYLHKASSTTQVADAIDDLIAADVDMVVRSATNFNSGWSDDSGSACQWVTDLTNAGILFFHGSGNFNQRHWEGNFKSTDGDLLHEWSNSPDETNSYTINNNTRYTAHLQWPGTPSSTNNYDLYLYDANLNLLDSSTGTSAFESVTWANTTGDTARIGLVVKKTNSTQTEFEIFVPNPGGRVMEYTSGFGSTASPANCSNDYSITLGVVDEDLYDTPNPPLEIYCSRGPTNDGAMRPDITAPDGVHLVSYPGTGGFTGASAGGPNAVGLAAVLWSEHPYLSPDGLMDVIYGLAELYNDWGDPGMDNSFGRGGIELPNYTANSRFIIKDVVNGGISNRPYNAIEQADAIAPANLNLFFLGKTFVAPTTPASDVLNKEMIYRSLKDDVIIKGN